MKRTSLSSSLSIIIIIIQEMYVSAVGDGVDTYDLLTDGHIMYDPRFRVLVDGVMV